MWSTPLVGRWAGVDVIDEESALGSSPRLLVSSAHRSDEQLDVRSSRVVEERCCASNVTTGNQVVL